MLNEAMSQGAAIVPMYREAELPLSVRLLILFGGRKMDMISIGKFISALRKEKGLTQEQLGEKLGVTNKTVSRWETGTYLPPAEALLSMSELFSVSINEILSGRRLTDIEYKEKAEENLRQAVSESSFGLKERLDFFKRKWLREHIGLMTVMGIVLICIFGAGIIKADLLMLYVGVLLLVVFHCIRNNAMMSYAEAHAYDGKGNDSIG